MLIFRYLIKETLKSQMAIFFILMAIFVTLRFVRVLGDASDGDIPAGLVLGFLGLYAPILSSLVLPISAYLGIMLAHGRLYVDSEMTVMRACGISEWYITRVMLLLSVFIMIICGVITLYLAPSAAESEYQLREKARSEAGFSAIMPGRFQQTGNEKAVIFVHDIDSQDDTLKRVFLSQTQQDGNTDRVRVVQAKTGQIQNNPDGTRNLVLREGVQYEGTQTEKKYRKVAFDEYQIQIADEKQDEPRRKVSVLPTMELLSDDSIEARAELQWRIAIPLSIPFLVLIAVPLSSVDPRQGRFGKMFPAILLYLGYFLLLLASRRVLEDGKIPIQLGLWWVHGIMLIIGITLIVRDRRTGTELRARLLGRKQMFRILDLYIARTLLGTITVTLSVLIGLSALIKFVEQLRKLGEGNYDIVVAGLYVLLSLPRDLEQFFPMATLLGGLIGMGLLASNSELVVMQASGLSRWNIINSAMKSALIMILFVMAVGEWVTPYSESKAKEIRTEAISGGSLFSSDALTWAKDGEHFVSIGQVVTRESLRDISIFDFNSDLTLNTLTWAKEGNYDGEVWWLDDVSVTRFTDKHIDITDHARQQWNSTLTPDKLGIVAIKPEALSIQGLYDYVQYRKGNGQDSTRYELAFWRKVFQPVSIAVMLLMALSFIFGPLRSVTMGARVIMGVLTGFGFFITNEVFGPLSLVYSLPPVVAALLPSLLFAGVATLLLRR